MRKKVRNYILKVFIAEKDVSFVSEKMGISVGRHAELKSVQERA